MKKVLKYVIGFFVVLLLVIVSLNIYSNYLDKKIEEIYLKNKVLINHINGLAEKDKGNVLIEKSMSENNNILVMGSSELTSPVPENLKNLFPNNLYYGDISLVGHAYVQNALHAVDLGANYESIKDNNIMIVQSLQWFFDDEINIDGFFSNFSELQFYEFLHNSKISKENKVYLSKRYIELENSNISPINSVLHGRIDVDAEKYDSILKNVAYGNFINKQTYILARLYSSDSFVGKILYQLTRPYYYFRYKIMSIQDKYKTYKYLQNITRSNKEDIVNIDWDKIYSDGEDEGKTACTNNNLFVYDDYYNNYLEDKWDSIQDVYKNTSLLISKEWQDFEFFLKVSKELDIKPYIVIMSTNGRYYDYTGLEKEKRDELYNKIEEMSKEYGFEVLNLKDKEYTPYFYCDVMHLGWKGWPYVVQNTIEHFSK